MLTFIKKNTNYRYIGTKLDNKPHYIHFTDIF